MIAIIVTTSIDKNDCETFREYDLSRSGLAILDNFSGTMKSLLHCWIGNVDLTCVLVCGFICCHGEQSTEQLSSSDNTVNKCRLRFLHFMNSSIVTIALSYIGRIQLIVWNPKLQIEESCSFVKVCCIPRLMCSHQLQKETATEKVGEVAGRCEKPPAVVNINVIVKISDKKSVPVVRSGEHRARTQCRPYGFEQSSSPAKCGSMDERESVISKH